MSSTAFTPERIKYLRLLSRQYPNKAALYTEIINLRAILKMDTLPFLLIGFLLVAYFNLSIVGVALFGLAFAAVYLIYNNKEEDVGYDG